MDLIYEQWIVLEPLIGELPKRADGRGRPWRSSRQARVQHAQFSPLSKLRVRQHGHGRHTYTKGPRTGGLRVRQQTEADEEEGSENQAGNGPRQTDARR